MKTIIKSFIYCLSLLIFNNSVAETEIEKIRVAAERGSKIALYTLGVKYANGEGIKQDQESDLSGFFKPISFRNVGSGC